MNPADSIDAPVEVVGNPEEPDTQTDQTDQNVENVEDSSEVMDDALFDKLEVVPSAQSDTSEVQTPTDDS
jgi:hypothetical protein